MDCPRAGSQEARVVALPRASGAAGADGPRRVRVRPALVQRDSRLRRGPLSRMWAPERGLDPEPEGAAYGALQRAPWGDHSAS